MEMAKDLVARSRIVDSYFAIRGGGLTVDDMANAYEHASATSSTPGPNGVRPYSAADASGTLAVSHRPLHRPRRPHGDDVAPRRRARAGCAARARAHHARGAEGARRHRGEDDGRRLHGLVRLASRKPSSARSPSNAPSPSARASRCPSASASTPASRSRKTAICSARP